MQTIGKNVLDRAVALPKQYHTHKLVLMMQTLEVSSSKTCQVNCVDLFFVHLSLDSFCLPMHELNWRGENIVPRENEGQSENENFQESASIDENTAYKLHARVLLDRSW